MDFLCITSYVVMWLCLVQLMGDVMEKITRIVQKGIV